MISLDQVLLLQEKVENAVQKIAQLNTENDALRTKCAELTNALSAKTEQVSAFESDQNKIEEGILKALDRLNSVENSVLKAAGQIQPKTSPAVNPPESSPAASETESLPSTEKKPEVSPSPSVQKPAADSNGQFDIF